MKSLEREVEKAPIKREEDRRFMAENKRLQMQYKSNSNTNKAKK